MSAKSVALDIVSRCGRLDQLPRSGKVVPELGNQRIREVAVHSWRVVYEVNANGIRVLTLVHKRRASALGDLGR